jgi:hypothetical protein
MEEKNLSVPEYKNYEYALEQSYGIVRDKLLDIKDLKTQCRNSGSEYSETGNDRVIGLTYLGRRYTVTLPEISVSAADSEEEVLLREQVLILHYLTQAKGTPPTGKLITFRELPEGVVYNPTFIKRTVKPLVENFGKEPQRLVETGKFWSGRETDYGDTAVTIYAFSHVPLTIVLWHGDEEFVPEGNVVFDSNITDYLSTEDITVVTEILTWKLVRKLREN